MKNLSLPFIAAEQGIAKAARKLERPGGAEWLEKVLLVIQEVARRHAEFTADDVWARLGPDEGGSEYRSQMGMAFRQAQKLKWIVFSGTFRESMRAPQHRKAIRIWRSLVCPL